MEPLGSYLRQEREKQGRTLDEIARKTRISRTALKAIEFEQDNERLPPASYLRGFVKLYAQELGLNPDELLEGMPKQAVSDVRVALPRKVDLETSRRPLVRILLVALLLCVACLWAWHAFFGFGPGDTRAPATIVSPRPADPVAQSAAPEQPGTGEGEPAVPAEAAGVEAQPLAEPAQAAEPQPDAAPGTGAPVALDTTAADAAEQFTVRFAARGIVWLKLQADDGETVDITLRSRERYRISAERVLQVRIGNPAMVDAWYNDTPVSLDGTPGQPMDLTFPDSARQTEQREE